MAQRIKLRQVGAVNGSVPSRPPVVLGVPGKVKRTPPPVPPPTNASKIPKSHSARFFQAISNERVKIFE
jgi:hypothetical protein